LHFRDARVAGAWLLACLLAAAAAYSPLANQREAWRNQERLGRVEHSVRVPGGAVGPLDPSISLRVSRLDGLLSSWQTIGGCGTGSSTGAGGGIKWIGRGATGGLFNVQTLGTYMHLSQGYNLTLSTLITRDLGEKWNIGVSVPVLYKSYRNLYGRLDVANSGLGDVGALLTRRLGEINATSLTLYVGFPTGTYDAKIQTVPGYLTQEKQLGIGRFTGSLTLDHTLDQTWGLIVLGGTVGYRGGENKLKNYRAPVASVYGYSGYLLGPFVPSLGLAATRFFGVDRDQGLDQTVQLWAVSATVGLEWSNDWLAILGGFSLPFGWQTRGVVDGANTPDDAGLQPWTAGIGFSVSPF
jgi:hypothetical protein